VASRFEDEPEVRRIRTDPFFYALLGIIGSTYVVLVVGMLLADAVYVFTSDMSERLVLDFSSDGEGKMLATGDALDNRFAKYGLSITTDEPEKHQTRIIDTDKPSAANSNLGTPHQDFGGPGVGVGGRSRTPGANTMPLGNAIAIIPVGDPPTAEAASAELVANWVSPVHLDRLRLEQMTKAGGHAVTYNKAGNVISRHEIGAPAADQTLTVEIGDDDVSRVDVVLADNRTLVSLDYSASAQLTADLYRPGRQTVRAASVRVVPRGASQIQPSTEPGTIVCRWVDPIKIDEIQLLDINAAGGEVELFDLDGELLARHEISNLGPNSFQKLVMHTDDVARLEIHLPAGGALAEMQFTWKRRIRSAWQREHPRLAKVVFNPITNALGKPEIRYSIKLTLISCTITAILSLWVAIPIGYLMSRHQFPGRNLIDAILDIPIVLPPLVVGLSLLILFQYFPIRLREAVVYQIPAVIIAQFSVACAFAVRTMRATFDQIDARHEQVALTLGCTRMQAFGMVVVPEAKRGILTAGTLAWARSLGEFGPLLVFAGTTRNKTEVLSTTVFLELNVGNLGAAVAVSLIMVAAAVMVLVLARAWGTRNFAI